MNELLEVEDERLIEMWAETLKGFEHLPVDPQASYGAARPRTPGLSLLVVAVAVMAMGGAVNAGLPPTFAAVAGACLGVICLLLVAADFGWRRI